MPQIEGHSKVSASNLEKRWYKYKAPKEPKNTEKLLQ